MKHLFLSLGLLGLAACTTTGTVTTEQANEAFAKQIYADFASGNMEGFIGAMAQDIVWNEADNNPYFTDSPYLGLDKVMSGVFETLGRDWSVFTVSPESYLVDGDTVAMFGRYNATYKPTGKSMNPQVVHVWTIKDGKATAFQQYADTHAMNQVILPDLSYKTGNPAD